jgi:hypothetical protein
MSEPSEQLKRLLDVPFTFDPLRDPNWTPSREDYRHFRDAAVAALDAERAAHQQTRTALEASTELLANLLSTTSTRPSLHWRIQIDERVQENQRVLGLATPEADKA